MSIQEAIDRSVSHNETVSLDWTDTNEQELLTAPGLEDTARNPLEPVAWMEGWGTTDEGEEWRIHLYQAESPFLGSDDQ